MINPEILRLVSLPYEIRNYSGNLELEWRKIV